jgi:hypothetical protein
LKLAKLDGSLKQRQNKSPSSQGAGRQCPSTSKSGSATHNGQEIKLALVVAVVTIQVLQADAAEVILRNQLGQTVSVPLTVDVDAIQLQTSALARGVYFLEVKRGVQVFAQKLVLE